MKPIFINKCEISTDGHQHLFVHEQSNISKQLCKIIVESQIMKNKYTNNIYKKYYAVAYITLAFIFNLFLTRLILKTFFQKSPYTIVMMLNLKPTNLQKVLKSKVEIG